MGGFPVCAEIDREVVSESRRAGVVSAQNLLTRCFPVCAGIDPTSSEVVPDRRAGYGFPRVCGDRPRGCEVVLDGCRAGTCRGSIQLGQALRHLGWRNEGWQGVCRKWLRMVAEQGFASAQFNLGNMYDSGEGVPEDDREAVKWYRKAAEQGYASAQFNLAVMYYDGRRSAIRGLCYWHTHWANLFRRPGPEGIQ